MKSCAASTRNWPSACGRPSSATTPTITTCPGTDNPFQLSTLLIRLAPAIVFLIHGYWKLFGGHHDRTVALFLTVNLPQPEALAWLIGALEFVGGLALLTGVLMRPLAALLAIEMAVAIYKVRIPQDFIGGWEFELTLLLVCLGLAVWGRRSPSAEMLP
ncbi:MAG: DoxX family protein [bacterium]